MEFLTTNQYHYCPTLEKSMRRRYTLNSWVFSIDLTKSTADNSVFVKPTPLSTPWLINIVECTRECLDKGEFACGVFVDLQKAFDTADHETTC